MAKAKKKKRRAASATSKRTVTMTERQAEALELRKAGNNYRQIGKALGISPQASHKLVINALRAIAAKTAEAAPEVMRLELERLDEMLVGLWLKAQMGDKDAVAGVLRVMERRAKLLGLDAPAKSSLDVTTKDPVTVYVPDNGRGKG